MRFFATNLSNPIQGGLFLWQTEAQSEIISVRSIVVNLNGITEVLISRY